MERAGMLTYIFPHTPHFLAVLVLRLRWVCLCLTEHKVIQHKHLPVHNVRLDPALPGEVAAGCVVLATLRALVLWLVDIEQTGRVLAPPVTGKEGLVGVGRGLSVIE